MDAVPDKYFALVFNKEEVVTEENGRLLNMNEDMVMEITTCEIETKYRLLPVTKLGTSDHLYSWIVKKLAHEMAVPLAGSSVILSILG